MLRRHDLVLVSPAAWRALVAERRDLAGNTLIAGWVDRGWPLITRRMLPGEGAVLPLGLPLPPSHGKRRLALALAHDALVSSTPPPLLREAMRVAPPAWAPTLERLLALDAGMRVYGSLAWQYLTSLDYLTARSDLDMLLAMPPAADAPRLIAELAAIERSAPMHLDGELVRDDGASVNWRELHEGAVDVLVKTTREARLQETQRFLGGGQP
ncbi:malonate decarboxylase holo-[acyl-carrier-protein] synthase [Reyranella sp.]|uniref:malonate decarboxylase holo-[acyl-carrier-protein] synthase n=1 Tax=Reyranella sp. TaxID=1929291 RepID=UPI00378355E8